MDNQNEIADSQNGENNVVVEENDDVDVLKEKFEKLSSSNRQLFERTKKAETEAKELREFKVKAEAETKVKADSFKGNGEMPKQPNEPDYGRLAYLHARGFNDGEDIKVINEEATRLKLPLNEVLEFEHIKSKLQTNKETREAKAGIPSGGNRAGGSVKGDVDYWLSKGGLPDDQELAEKVVDARMKQDSGKKFADTMFNE